MNYRTRCKLFVIAGAFIALWDLAQLLSGPPGHAQSTQTAPATGQSFTPAPEWRPTHASASARYVGNAACAQCHNQAVTQPSTPMGKALETAAEGQILRSHHRMTFRVGPYSYSIVREGSRSIYSVTDGKEVVSVPILYAFGQGKAGQTYVFERDGKYYESRVSFYNEIAGLDFTLGAPRTVPASLEEATGRLMDSADTKDCFSCHATAAVSQSRLELSRMTPGITCEGCHGAGEQHVAVMKARSRQPRGDEGLNPQSAARGPQSTGILNPGRFDTSGQTEFCGSCHRTWAHVQLMRMQGVGTVRFQPYRIFNSKCYDFDDKRISCTACHNPHEEMKRDAAFYDARCTACHQAVQKPAGSGRHYPVCPTGKRDCASCHMPKYEVPGSHFKFTDHYIRIVRPGEPYPY